MGKATKSGNDPPPETLRDTLYSAPLSEFVALRARLGAELRTGGKEEMAAAVLAMRKPTAPAWGLNQLARRHPERLTELYEARADAERVQAQGDTGRLRAAISRYRGRLDELVAWVETCLAESGGRPTKEHLHGVRDALDAASMNPAGAGAELAAACLVQALTHEGSAAEEIAPLAASPERSREPPRKEDGVVELAARRLREQAQGRLEETAVDLRDAESREAAARAQLEAAEQSLATAARDVGEARARHEAARRAVVAADTKR